VTCVNLWHNPRNAIEALALSRLIAHSTPPLVPSKEATQGALQLRMDGLKFGEALAVPWQTLKQTPWGFPCAFAQSDLIRVHYTLLEGSFNLPGQEKSVRIPLCSLGDLASLGPDPRDIYDAFDIASGKTAYPAIWGAKDMNTMAQSPNCFLEPLAKARPRRNLRKVEDLWPKAGRVLITQRPRLNTKTLAAMRVDRRVLAQVWWPVVMSGNFRDVAEAEKTLTLWLNSTLGLIFLISNREETQGPWVQFKKPVLENMPTLDLRRLSKQQLSTLASAYDALHSSALHPFPKMHRDPIREKIDDVVSRVLRLPKLDILRELLSHEPILSLSLSHLVRNSNPAH
ncbi:MAG: hypothetical protein ACRD4D_06380, partial [Candidatus Acidiferrales bacterium]